MNTSTDPVASDALPEASPSAAARHAVALAGAWNNIFAIAGVVLKELYRRKDFYVLFVLTVLITLVMGSVNVFNQDNVVRYLKEICLFLIWAAALVIAVTSTARQLPAERENRTLLPLLAKPVTRTEFLLGKFLGCWLASGVSLAVFYLFFGLVTGAREHQWPVLQYFQALTLHWGMLGIVCALTLLGSIVFAAPSSNNTITLVVTVGLLLVGRHLNKVAVKLSEPVQTLLSALYFLVPHLEFFDVRDLIVHNWGLVPWAVWAGALAYAVLYGGIFLTVACLLFRRKALS